MLLSWYRRQGTDDEERIIEFHQRFGSIHPFQGGNGRVGRLVMFKECLAAQDKFKAMPGYFRIKY